MASDRIIATTPGVCPHCGNRADDPSTPDYFDNVEDEYTWCYQCKNHATNPRWRGPSQYHADYPLGA